MPSMPILSLTASFLLAIAQATTASPAAAPLPAGPATKPADLPTPQDAKERMALAEKVNGLAGLDLPWHLKATFEVLAAGASTPETGTYEEWHGTDKQYHVAIHSPTTSVEEYGNAQGEFRVGTQDWPLLPVSAIRKMVIQPVDPSNDPEKFALQNYERKFGPDKYQCTAVMVKKSSERPEDANSFCFLPTNAVVLLTSTEEKLFQTVYERSSRVHGRYLAHDMQMFLGGVPWMKVHIDSLESLSPSALTALKVPPDARAVTPRLYRGNVVAGRLVTKTVPSYPSSAKQLGIEGRLVLDGVVDKAGHFTKLVVLSGPIQLKQPALDAVRQWTYEPFLLDGQPVESEIRVTVIFRLGS